MELPTHRDFPVVSNNFSRPPLTNEPLVDSLAQNSGSRKTTTDHSEPGKKHATPTNPNTARVSYSSKLKDAASKPPDVLAQDFCSLHPIKKNNILTFDIPDELYQEQLQSFKFALHARLILQKGDSPRAAKDIQTELQSIWNIADPWQVIPIGKGFFTLKFSGERDMALAKSKAFWKLRTGIFKIREWTPLFNPYKESAALSQVWMRIYYLPHEIWHPEVISGIARSVGSPIKIDGSTFLGSVGHFARVLMEIDMTKEITYSLKVNRGSTSFDIEFVYENLPYFCGICRKVGHSSDKCRNNKDQKVNQALEDKHKDLAGKENKNTVVTERNKEYKTSGKTWQSAKAPEVLTKNSFEALELVESENTTLEGKNKGDAPEKIHEVQTKEVSTFTGVDNEQQDLVEGLVTSDEEEEEQPSPKLDTGKGMTESQFVDAVSNLVNEEMEWVKEKEKISAAKKIEATKFQAKMETAIGKTTEQAPIKRVLRSTAKQVPIGKELTKNKKNKAAESCKSRTKQESSKLGIDIINEQLSLAHAAGRNPRDFVIDSSNSPHMRTMSNVANQSWADEVENEDLSSATTSSFQ
ncbi:uncharacterized protein LOC131002938 [Salvia miltiorrhiza]|uniref:uncharacterized protein LOC131002938 n=1 Tax=Salvia miltiorrhiza TaxID=226208 RepID=UPI0025AD5776|nr:uncharacterized protein LOC131002938 [Salvia miltiorrhiza]